MIKISFSKVKPCDQIWKLLTDTATWPHWGPSVKAVECADRFIREGSVGRIKIAVGIWVPFVITRYDEELFWSWKVAGVPATGHRIETVENVLCRLIFEVPLFVAPYAYICKIALERINILLE
jgi:hypothetical protein